MAFRWRANDGPLGSFVSFYGIWNSFSKKSYIFQRGGGGSGPPAPPLDPRMVAHIHIVCMLIIINLKLLLVSIDTVSKGVLKQAFVHMR